MSILNEIDVVILAGGRGTRMQEVTAEIPKPMIQIGGKPILWHIMKIFYHSGVKNFNLALGYKGEYIKEFFLNYSKYFSSIEINFDNNQTSYIDKIKEKWKVKLIDTGLKSETGSRLSLIKGYLKPNQPFFFTYGDGVANINLENLYKFHLKHGKIATLSSVTPPSRFGAINILENNIINKFAEKPNQENYRINGGFFVLSPKVFDYVSDDINCIFERLPLEKLAAEGELVAYNHDGFWQCMDTVRDCEQLNDKWNNNQAIWKNW